MVCLVDLVYIKNCPRYVATNLYSYKGYEEERGRVLRPRILFRGKLGAVHLLCHIILASSGPPPPPPNMYDAINEYVISLSEYFSDIISNG